MSVDISKINLLRFSNIRRFIQIPISESPLRRTRKTRPVVYAFKRNIQTPETSCWHLPTFTATSQDHRGKRTDALKEVQFRCFTASRCICPGYRAWLLIMVSWCLGRFNSLSKVTLGKDKLNKWGCGVLPRRNMLLSISPGTLSFLNPGYVS